MTTWTRDRPGRRRETALIGVATFATLVLGACATTSSEPPAVTTADVERRVVTVADAPAATSVVEATDRLGLTMLDAAPREGNVVVSPS